MMVTRAFMKVSSGANIVQGVKGLTWRSRGSLNEVLEATAILPTAPLRDSELPMIMALRVGRLAVSERTATHL